MEYEVIIVGGSAAGLSAALTLGRSLRKVLVIDAGLPCNRQSPYSHNFITQDGIPAKQIISRAREQVLKYETVSFLDDKVIRIESGNDLFSVETETGKRFSAIKVLLATGLTDITPDVEGFSECWGISILHCPYCHGYEVRDAPTAILANGEAAYHTGMTIHNWTKNLTIITNGISELRHYETEKLDASGISVVEKQISRIEHTDGSLEKIHFTDGSHLSVQALYASIPFSQQNDLAEMIGCKMTPKGHIEIDEHQRTTVDGIYAAGDNTAEYRAISVASAAGTVAGFTINADLTRMKMPTVS